MLITVWSRKLVLHFLNVVSSLFSLVPLSWLLARAPRCLRVWDGWSALTGSEHSYSPVLELINFLGNWDVGEHKADTCGSAGVILCPAGLAWGQNWVSTNLLVSAFQEGETEVSRWWWTSQPESCRLTSGVLCSTKTAKCLLGLTNNLFGFCDTAFHRKTLLNLNRFCKVLFARVYHLG